MDWSIRSQSCGSLPGLPDGSGLAWMQNLRQSKRTQHLPVVIVGDREGSIDIQACPLIIEWLPEEFEENQLIEAVNVAVQGTRLQMAKVLIVEDDSATRQILAHQLSELGIKTIEAANGEQAVDMVKSLTPDLIILDVSVPAPDGFAIVEVLQQTAAKATPLIVYTSLDLTQDDMRRLRLGSTRHLIKSRTTESELLQAVRELLI